MSCASHCWHMHQGVLCMVIPDGHIVQSCCVCGTLRTIHMDHAASTHRTLAEKAQDPVSAFDISYKW